MNFFEQQEQARRQTLWLMLLFATATMLIIIAVYLAVSVGLFFAQLFQGSQNYFFIDTLWEPRRFVYVTAGTVAVIAAGSLYRMHQLRQGGGAAVAGMLGGKRLPNSEQEPLLRRLLNIVAEMAIASGVPTPPVYLLEQEGINAFAAGFSPSDAVVAVSRGAVEMLSRDELQGVMAHEFGHIVNGDIALKMRLMGLLHGITLISDAGILLLTSRHSVAYSTRERGTHPALVVLGLLLFFVGTIGAVFADMIKRAVSRQREYLADAAAVQFTRNPEGIASALKVIGGYKPGSRIVHAAASQASHFFFSNALKSWQAKDWWATHPPLVERIRRLDRRFDGDFEKVNYSERKSRVLNELAVTFAAAESAPEAAAPKQSSQIMQGVGNPGFEDLQRARKLLEEMPARLADGAGDPFSARAIVYALLLDRDSARRTRQLDLLRTRADANVFRELLDIQPLVAGLAAELRLTLIDLALPALKSLSGVQFRLFRSCVHLLIHTDKRIDLFEYMLQRLLLRHLYPAFVKVRPLGVLFDVAGEIAEEFACIAALMVGYGRHDDPARVYTSAMQIFSVSRVPPMPAPPACTVTALDHALRRLERAAPEIKQRAMEACIYCMLADGNAAAQEMELLRTIADALDCPMPPPKISGPPRESAFEIPFE